jgi:hypothetical protein
MRHHHKRKLSLPGSIRKPILLPEGRERFVNHRKLVMAVERALAEAGKMFAAPQNPGVRQPGKELADIFHGIHGIGRDCTRRHHLARCLEGKIEYGGEVYVKAECTAVLADNLAVLAKHVGIACGKDIRRRRRRPKGLAKTVDAPAFQIDASEKGRRNAFLAFPQQLPGLFWRLNVTGEKNHAGRLQTAKQGSESCADLDSIESYDQQLSRIPQKFLRVPLWLNFFLQFRQQVQRLKRCEAVEIDIAQFIQDWLRQWRKDGQLRRRRTRARR